MTARTEKEKTILREGGKRLAAVMGKVAEAVRPGVSAVDLDRLAESLILSYGGKPSFKGYKGAHAVAPYPSALCVSVNHEVVHAIPYQEKILKQGDIVSLDLGMWYKGLTTDMALTLSVGKVSKDDKKIVETAKEALREGVGAIKPGRTIGHISSAIERLIEKKGLSVIRDLGGHGVGRAVHEEPMVPNIGDPGEGEELIPGLVLAIEPMVTSGSGEVEEKKDGWTWVTKDGAKAAHFEHTIMVTEKGAEILTRP